MVNQRMRTSPLSKSSRVSVNLVNPLAVVVAPKVGSIEIENVSKPVTKPTSKLLFSTSSPSVNVLMDTIETKRLKTV